MNNNSLYTWKFVWIPGRGTVSAWCEVDAQGKAIRAVDYPDAIL